MEEIKDVEIAGVKYQIGRFTARNGSWILAQVLTKMMPSIVEKAFAKQGAKLAKGRADLSEEEFASIQSHCLGVIRRYTKAGLPMPVFVIPDRWVAKEMEYDLTAVLLLTVHALVFNLGSFFVEGGLALLMSAIPGLEEKVAAAQAALDADPGSPDTQPSTPTPGDQ